MKEQCICVKFSFRLGKTESKMHKILTVAFGDMLWWELGLLSVCRNSEVGKFCWKLVSIQVVLPQVTQTKIRRMFTKSLTETSKSTLLKFPARLGLSCDMCQKILVEDLGV